MGNEYLINYGKKLSSNKLIIQLDAIFTFHKKIKINGLKKKFII